MEDNIENRLINICKKILNVTNININDSFLYLGGHSLKAIELECMIKKEFNVEISIRKIFKVVTIKEIASYIRNAEKKESVIIMPTEKREYYPLSSAEKRMFILNQMNRSSINYNVPIIVKIEGKIDKVRFNKSIIELVKRHESLRTSFENIDGEVVQIVNDKNIIPEITYIKAQKNQVNDTIKEFIRPFDLSKAPLIRVVLIEILEKEYVLLINTHHIIMDGISVGILLKEFSYLYNKRELPKMTIQYKDYCIWQNKEMKSDNIKMQERYWLKVFKKEIPVLNLLTDYKRPSIKTFEGNTISFEIGNELSEKLKKIAYITGSTMYMVFLSVVNILLSKYTGQEDIIIGTPIAGRRIDQIKNVIGMFVNTLAMRNYPTMDKSYVEFLTEVRENSINAYENQDYQFEELVNKLNIPRDSGRNPLFDVMFTMINDSEENIDVGNFIIKKYDYKCNVVKFDLIFSVIKKSGQFEINIEYSSKLFKKATIQMMAEHLKAIFNSIVNNQEVKLGEIEIITKEEKNKLLYQFNNTVSNYSQSRTITGLFEDQVKKIPDNTALIFENKKLSYKKLNEKVNSLARVLREKGVEKDVIVGIMIEKSIEMIVGIMAILKAGGAYLPIDPEYPKDRINYVIDDSGTKLVITQKKFEGRIQNKIVEICYIDNEELYKYDVDNLGEIAGKDNLAYVIYTSGTTGRPKGVMIKHSSMMNTLMFLQKHYTMDQNGAYLQKTNYSFDVSISEIFGWFIGGGKLVILGKGYEKDAKNVIKTIIDNSVSHVNFTSSMFNLFLNEINEDNVKKLKRLKYILTAGEALKIKNNNIFQKLIKVTNIENLYGPTEASIYATKYSLNNILGDIPNNIPIGKPIDNIRIYIVDRNNKLVPVGVAGELCISGEGLAKGYLNNEKLTNKKFVVNPYDPQERMYKTGDLARWLSDGNIEYLGRIDHQVKIRGFRIEVGEIESNLLKIEGIKECIVIARDEGYNKYLCAYYVGEKDYNVREIREKLSEKIPEYMLPSYFVKLNNMPVTTNGKIDRRALPKLEWKINTGVKYEAPRDEVENKLVEIWEKVLGTKNIGIDDNFFEIGGDSIRAVNVASKIAQKLNVSISVSNVYVFKNIRNISQFVKKNSIQEDFWQDENLVFLKKSDSADKNIFFIHDGTGQVDGYIELVKKISSQYNCWGLNFREYKEYYPKNINIEELANQYLLVIKNIQKSGPYYIAGWSNGGTIAYEIVRQIELLGESVKVFFVIDSVPPNIYLSKKIPKFNVDTEKKFLGKVIDKFDIEQLAKNNISLESIYSLVVNKLEDLNIIIENIKYRGIMENMPNYNKMSGIEKIRFINIIRSINCACLRYIPKSNISTEVNYIKATKSVNIIDKEWQSYCNTKINVHNVNGSHFSIFRQPYVNEVSKIINNLL
ncbi:non-ribosomal peptide synthetase [Clostridium felsineum]|uniref:non-ribosomal peptide synthetase n=1 Tax=Clostridium felsineum TaxID=36839 RepID=UPI00098BEA5C|nr:non-ribosomal peptide synthetase [Clostridium felsineum]URZ17242.1 Gramicidin S synthase 2 [Clostridium felsineum DSM 794]